MHAYNEVSGFKTQVWYRGSPWGGLGTSTQTGFSFGGFPSIFFLMGDVSLRTGPPPPLEWFPFLPLVAAVLITTKGTESLGSGRIGVIVALVFVHLRPLRINFTFPGRPSSAQRH